MDRRKRRPSTDGPEPHPPKQRSPMAPDDNRQQSSAPSSSLDPSQTHPLTLQTGDNSLDDWHSGAYIVPHGTATTSSDSHSPSSVTTLPGLSYNHPHLYSSPPSHQVVPTDPQSLQSRDIPHDRCNRPVGPHLGVPGPAPTFGLSGDPRKLWMPWPKRATELSVSDSQSHASASSLQNHATSSQTLNENVHRDRHDRSYLRHPQIAPRSPSGDPPSLQLPRMEVTPWRSNPNGSSQSSTPIPGSSVPTTPVPSSPAHSDRSLSPPSSLSCSETPCASPNPWSPYGNNAHIRTQLENAGINFPVPPVSERTPSSSAGPSDGKKKSIIGATRLILQTASTALKFSPIPFLPNIPDLLLTLLQVYEVQLLTTSNDMFLMFASLT
ncbi:uncharacterized protein EI90DRAFT_329279 [Cantharellus anzutake]|uniref:uncharacterized protein n=1 Tax=Cantharellus anzutake TaxID=1750568 RepID=UPI00190481B3|nr:uncharacterized protein EI90DRAFT_329279 [Cantharellus anzutake]KAF8335422.1 hypothetical protein EI90DRAFT_329279 [Cantharellus anzutake]